MSQVSISWNLLLGNFLEIDILKKLSCFSVIVEEQSIRRFVFAHNILMYNLFFTTKKKRDIAVTLYIRHHTEYECAAS